MPFIAAIVLPEQKPNNNTRFTYKATIGGGIWTFVLEYEGQMFNQQLNMYTENRHSWKVVSVDTDQTSVGYSTKIFTLNQSRFIRESFIAGLNDRIHIQVTDYVCVTATVVP